MSLYTAWRNEMKNKPKETKKFQIERERTESKKK